MGIGSRLALTFVVTTACLAGCMRPPGLDFFPEAVNDAEAAPTGEPVAWRGLFIGMRPVQKREWPSSVYVDASGRWALLFRVINAIPEAGPFEAKNQMTIIAATPQGFFSANDVVLGRLVDVKMTVWRDGANRLRARIDSVGRASGKFKK